MLWLAVVLLLFFVQVGVLMILELRHPAKALAWIFISFCLPFVSLLPYVVLARRYKLAAPSNRGRDARDSTPPMSGRCGVFSSSPDGQGDRPVAVSAESYERLFTVLSGLSNGTAAIGGHTDVFRDGAGAYRSMLEAMERAEQHIHVEFYIIRNDAAGRQFQSVWMRKAREGVKVRIICDGVGSMELDRTFIDALRAAGVEFRVFLPPRFTLFKQRINFRNHRKIVVVDGKVGFVGGLNIGEEYLGAHPKLGYWRDTHIRLTGRAVHGLQRAFLTDWEVVNKHRPEEEGLFPIDAASGTADKHTGGMVQWITSGPDLCRSPILDAFFALVNGARTRIYITTPYFIPHESLSYALKSAASAGLDVRILIPKNPDYKLVRWASLAYVEDLLRAGVRFFEYTKGFIHAKVVIVDHVVASVGTANMDLRSFFHNFELNALLFDPQTIERLARDFADDLAESEEIQLKAFSARPRLQKGMEAVARLISPIL